MATKQENQTLLNLVKDAAKSQQQIADMKETLTNFCDESRKLISMVEKLYHTVYGNGQPGLVQGMQQIDDRVNGLEGVLKEVHGGRKVLSVLWGIIGAVAVIVIERILQ